MVSLNHYQLEYQRNPGSPQVRAWMNTNTLQRTGRTHALLAKAIEKALWATPGQSVCLTDHVINATWEMHNHMHRALMDIVERYNLNPHLMVRVIRYSRGVKYHHQVGHPPTLGLSCIIITRI